MTTLTDVKDLPDPRLERFLPIRVILRKEPDGHYQGYIEHSFAKDWAEHRVNIWWSGKAYSMLGEHILDGIKNAESHLTDINKAGPRGEIFDPFSPECPVIIDWASWLEAKTKFDKRNAFFEHKS